MKHFYLSYCIDVVHMVLCDSILSKVSSINKTENHILKLAMLTVSVHVHCEPLNNTQP